MTWIILQFRGILSNHSSKIRTLYHSALPFYSLLCTIQANKMITRYVFFESVSLCYKFRWNPFVPLVGWTLVFFSYQKLWGTVQFSSDDMMLFLTFRPSLFVKICSCQREIQSHLTDRLWLDWIRFATFYELVERFPRWTGEISWSAAGRRIYKASLLRKVFSEAELCMRRRRRRAMIFTKCWCSSCMYRVVFLTGPPDFQYQNEKQVAANQD